MPSRTVDECLKLLADDAADTKVIAGGTGLVPQMKNGVTKPARVVDLSGVAALRAVQAYHATRPGASLASTSQTACIV